MQEEIRYHWHFNQPPQEIWKYLTMPELLEQWLTKTDIQPVVGHKFHFFDKLGKVVDCEVLEVQPVTRFTYSWQYSSAKDGKVINSKVEWTLVPKEAGTQLQLVHTGFTVLEDQLAHSKGWNNCINRLIEHINPVPTDGNPA